MYIDSNNDFHCDCCSRKKSKERYWSHRDEQRAQSRRYYNEHRVRLLKKSVDYRANNLERVRETQRNYYRNRVLVPTICDTCKNVYRKHKHTKRNECRACRIRRITAIGNNAKR